MEDNSPLWRPLDGLNNRYSLKFEGRARGETRRREQPGADVKRVEFGNLQGVNYFPGPIRLVQVRTNYICGNRRAISCGLLSDSRLKL